VLLTAEGCLSNNGTKSTPVLSGDILGDWREEVILRSSDNKELRIYSTTIPTKYRMVTLLQDPQYRLALAWQNTAYNQPPHPSFYLDDAAPLPPKPVIAHPKKPLP
jgi:rhamnogalacturonan endolyase